MSTGVCDTCVRRIHSYQMISAVTANAGRELGREEQRDPRRPIDDHDADAGAMGRTPEVEARDRQHHQRGEGEAVQKEIERRGESRRRREPTREPPPATTAQPAPLCAPQSTAGRARRAAAGRIPSVTSAAVRTDRVDRRQSSSAPVKSSSNNAASVSSAANRRPRMRRRAAARSSSDTVTATSGSSDGERMMNAVGSDSGPPSNWRRNATGTILVSSKNVAPSAAPPDPRQLRFRDHRADVARRIGGIEHGLDANQLQALAYFVRGRARPVRSGDHRGRFRIGPSTRPVHPCPRRPRAPRSALRPRPSPARTAGAAPLDRPDRRGAARPGRAAPRAPPCRGGWSTRRIHPPPRPSAGPARSRGPRPAACARSPPRRWRWRRRPRGRRPRAGPTARVTKEGKVIRSVIVECELC